MNTIAHRFPWGHKIARLWIIAYFLELLGSFDVYFSEILRSSYISFANQMAIYALRNTACEFSINNYAHQLRELGFTSNWNKTRAIAELLEQAYLFFTVHEYTTALKPGTTAPPKAYAIDQGLAYAVSRANQQDVGKRLESAVYLELRRRLAGKRTETVTSLTVDNAKSQKVDFLVGDATAAEPYELYQVCVEMSSAKTRGRELGSLDASFKRTGLNDGYVITMREEGTEQLDHGTARIIPAWKWALRSTVKERAL